MKNVTIRWEQHECNYDGTPQNTYLKVGISQYGPGSTLPTFLQEIDSTWGIGRISNIHVVTQVFKNVLSSSTGPTVCIRDSPRGK